MRRALSLILVSSVLQLGAQESNPDTSSLTISAFADGYYAWYDNDNTARTSIQQHECIGAYGNDFGLNVAQLSSSFSSKRVRGVATLHFGDLPAIAWDPNYRFLQEANAGVRLAKGLWLDMGYFKTHVGTESFLAKDNLLSIISLSTFYGPFYQGGARLTYETESKWHFEGHVINGYNLHVENNKYKTFGMLISKEFSKKLFMSYSNMFGQERVGSLFDGYLIYQNIFTNLDFDKIEVQMGMDVAIADRYILNDSQDDWTNPLIAGLATVKYHVSDHFAISFRGEIFEDRGSVISFRIVPTIRPDGTPMNQVIRSKLGGLTVYGGTVGVEYKPSKQGYLRIESRYLYDPNALVKTYPDGFIAPLNPMLEDRLQAMATVGFYFDKKFKFAK